MTDNQPDQISWAESGIIIKQLGIIIISVGGLLGVVFSPQQVAEITEIATGVVTIGLSLWSVHNRLTRNCPPISKPKEGK